MLYRLRKKVVLICTNYVGEENHYVGYVHTYHLHQCDSNTNFVKFIEKMSNEKSVK